MDNQENRPPRREYPPVFERVVPIALVILVLLIIVVLFIIVGVALGFVADGV